MVFKSEEELKDYLLRQSAYALKDAQDEVYNIINQFVKEFYNDYSPEMYERTYQLYSSLVKSGIEWTGNGYRAFVYFDYDSLEYITGARPSGEQVMDAAASGWHGATGLKMVRGHFGFNIWDSPVRLISEDAIQMLKEKLVNRGIPVR